MVTEKELDETFSAQTGSLKKQLDGSISAIRLKIIKPINDENHKLKATIKFLESKVNLLGLKVEENLKCQGNTNVIEYHLTVANQDLEVMAFDKLRSNK